MSLGSAPKSEDRGSDRDGGPPLQVYCNGPVLTGPERVLYGVWSVPGVSRLWEATYELQRSRSRRETVQKVGRWVTLQFDGWRLSYDLSNAGDFAQYSWATRGRGAEVATTALIREFLRPGSRFADIGANIGYYTAAAIPLVGTRGTIWSFEPNPQTFERLRQNIRLNQGGGIVRARCVALADTAGSRPLYLFGNHDGLSSLVARARSSVDVEVARADDLLANERLDLIKMDIEGAELSALGGMTTLLRHNPALRLIIEWNRRYRTRELWALLSARFTVYRIRETSEGYGLTKLRSYDDARRLPLVNLLCEPA